MPGVRENQCECVNRCELEYVTLTTCSTRPCTLLPWRFRPSLSRDWDGQDFNSAQMIANLVRRNKMSVESSYPGENSMKYDNSELGNLQ